MFPSSLNTKRRAACAAKEQNISKNILSKEDKKNIEEAYSNISHIGSFLKKRSSFSSTNTISSKPATQAVNTNKKLKKTLKDLPNIHKDSQFLIIDSDSENSSYDEVYMRNISKESFSPSKFKGPCAQSYNQQNDSFFINGYPKNQNIERHNFSIEATYSESSTASSEFRVEEDIDVEEPLKYKKVKTEQDSSSRNCCRKDSMLSSSSETQVWFGGNSERNHYLDDSYTLSGVLSSNFPTPIISSITPQSNVNSSRISTYKNDNSCFQLDDSESMNLPTRKNSLDSSPIDCSPLKVNEQCIQTGSNGLNDVKLQFKTLDILQQQDLHQQIQIDEELVASQTKEQEEKEQLLKMQIQQGRKLVEQRMGRLAAENQVINGFPCCTFTIRCFLKHTFVINVEDLLAGTWCEKCQENLQKAQEYAEENKGILLSQFYGKNLKFQCQKGHCWESSHQTYKSRWCSQCKKIIKDQFKQYIKDEEAKKQAEYQKNQEEMYQEARRKAMTSQTSNETNPSSDEYKKKVILAAKQVEREVEKIAEQQARDYIKNEQNETENPCSFVQLREMFKVILFPDTILQVYFTNLEVEVLKSEYRNIARHVHPDKNSHPRAAESFQKLNNFYTLALPKN